MEASVGLPRRLRVDLVEVVVKEGALGRNCLRRLVGGAFFPSGAEAQVFHALSFHFL